MHNALARNVGDHFNIKASLLKLGVHVVSVTEPIDGKPEGRLLETILAGFAQFDNDIRAARTVQGMRRKIEDGIFPWKPPLGYRRGERSGAKKTSPDQPDYPTFTILQKGWVEFSTGKYTKAEILRLLTARGLRTRTGKPLANQTVDNIFSDIFYAGVIRDPWSKDEYVGKHLPMVNRSTYDAVQHIIRGRNRSIPHRAIRPEFPLRSFVRCASCEFPLTGSFSRGRSKVYPYYHCNHHDCESPSIYTRADVHSEFTDFLSGSSADRHIFDHLREKVSEIAMSWAELGRSLHDRRTADIKRTQEQRQRLIQMKINELITDDEFRTQKLMLDAQEADVQKRVIVQTQDAESVLGDLDLICAPLMNLAEFWNTRTVEIQRRFQQIMLPTGFVYGRSGTAQKAHILSFIEGSLPYNPIEVASACDSWNQLMNEIKKFAALVRGEPDPDEGWHNLRRERGSNTR